MQLQRFPYYNLHERSISLILPILDDDPRHHSNRCASCISGTHTIVMCNPTLYNRIIETNPRRSHVQRQTTTNLRRKGSSQSISDGQSNSPISTKRDVKEKL